MSKTLTPFTLNIYMIIIHIFNINKNNEEELSDYLLSKGKSPKSICPIIFITEEDRSEAVSLNEE